MSDSKTKRQPQSLAATTVGLRKADAANFEAAGVLRPGASPPEVRSEVIALGRAAMEAGWRLEGPRVLGATGEPTPRGHAVEAARAVLPYGGGPLGDARKPAPGD